MPSILRGFSAPVRLNSDLSDADLYFLLANDSDEFNWYVIVMSCDDLMGNFLNLKHFFSILVGSPDKFWQGN